MRLFVLCLVAATLLWPALAQAPGDREDDCGDDDHSYPPEWHVLFDTWNYVDLFDRGPLRVLNNDGGSGWFAGSGGPCREQLRICDYRQDFQPQNNWVFTQFISFDEATEIYVNVSYQYSACISNARRGCNTLQTTLYRYETNGANNAARVIPANYLPNEVQVLSLMSNENTVMRTATFRPSATANGFYLGVLDTGTCGSIVRITAYYRVCPEIIQGLVTLPEIPLPRAGSLQPITRNAICADNSRRLPQISLIRRAFSDGRCETSASCACDSGYRNVPVPRSSEERCQACEAGTYRSASVSSTTCLDCPGNTTVTVVAAPICACVEGFYRTSTEGATIGCTSPPTACTNLRVESRTATTVNIRWNRPAIIGRPDYFYSVDVSDPDRVHAFVEDNSNYRDTRVRPTYSVSPLVPHTSYVIRVSVHNGVSDQDPDGHLRTCDVNVMTREGVPGPPRNVTGLCTVVVWQPPEQPNGVITGYDIRFFRGSTSGLIIPKGSNDLFHEVVISDIPSGASQDVTVQVRAKNAAHDGIWSPKVALGTIPGCPDPTGDIDECDTNNGGCSQNCTNTPGSRVCSCRAGFRLSSNGRTCQDINECNTNNGDCEQICTNTQGSRVCSCRSGFVIERNGCRDINECDINNGNCDQICTNTPGSRVCSCRAGFRLASDGTTCLDINECNTNNGGCQHICINTQGSRVCSCRSGFVIERNGCRDIDECDTNNGNCGQICTNVPGSRVCSCNTGFRLASNDITCLDINECNINNGDCQQICTNTQGSRVCSCRSGLVIERNGCRDIDECDTNNGGCSQTCTNTPGSRVCSCRCGYILASNDRTCLDINECNTNNGGCEQICTNTPGSRECSCRSGFVLDRNGITCRGELTVRISVDYDPPADFTPGPNEYRAASGPVTVTCTATGTGTGPVSYQWSSTCRSCPFQTATTSSIFRAAVHSGDTGTHTCVATQEDGTTASASIDFNVVDAGIQLFRGSPRGSLPNNGLAISDDPNSSFRLRIFCRSDSMLPNVGQFIGLDGTALTSNSFFDIAHPQPGELTVENIVGSQSALTASQQGVYTCRIPLQSGELREINVGVYPNGFNTQPSVTSLTSISLNSTTVLTCTTTGSPATTVTWTRDGQPVTIDGRTYNMVQTVTNRASATYENVLTVGEPASGNTFTCTVTNTLGSDTSD